MKRLSCFQWVASSVTCWALVCAGGCGKSAGPKKVKVHGMVTLDAVPLDNGSVTFVQASSRAAVGGGEIKAGAFLTQLPPGSYLVQIVASRPVPGQTIPEMGNTPVLESIIPARYNSATTLAAEVSEESNSLTFPLQSK